MNQVISPGEATRVSPLRPSAPDFSRRLRLLLRQALGVPLFYKVLVANALLVALGAVLGTRFALQFIANGEGVPRLELVPFMVVLAIAVTVAINFAVLKAALQPLDVLGRVVDEVRSGNLHVRAPQVLFTDPVMERLNETLNAILDELQQHQEQLQTMSYQVLQAQEDERKRIARELHDETAQVLTTLLIGLKMLERARDTTELRRHTAQLRQLTSQALEEVRNMALELRPTTLDDLGLVAALESYTDAYEQRLHIPVQFEALGFERRLSPQVELVLYRVVQEALTNVARHASAEHVEVLLSHSGNEVVASVRDDGVGFDTGLVLKSKETGLGLFGMRERLALVGGRLNVESRPGQGTTISAQVPLDGELATNDDE